MMIQMIFSQLKSTRDYWRQKLSITKDMLPELALEFEAEWGRPPESLYE